MKEVVIGAVIAVGAYFLTHNNDVKETKEPTPVEQVQIEDFTKCDCCIDGKPCTCENCDCENCTCKEVSVLEKEVVVEKFDSSFIEADITDLKVRMNALENDLTSVSVDVKELKNKPHLTEERVREIVKEEIEVAYKIQTKEGKVVEKKATIEHTGTEIVIPPGGRLLSIEDVGVKQRNVYQPTQAVQYYTDQFYYEVPMNDYMYGQPIVGTMGTCVNGVCSPSYNSYNGGFSTCGPGGCN